MRLIILRHGQTVGNVNRIIQGQLPGELTTKGIDQAKKLGLRLKDTHIDHIYSSDLQRTINTAKEILPYHPNLKLKLDERLRERFFSKYQGKQFPRDWDWNNLPEDVESDEQLCARVKEFMLEILDKHQDETVVLACHGGTKMALLTVIHDLPHTEFENWGTMKNTSISEFEITELGNHKMISINCINHLK